MARSSPRRRTRGRWRVWIGYLLSFLFGSFLTLVGYTYLVREKPLSPETFSQKAVLIGRVIQSQLYEIGIQKKDVSLHQSSLKKEGPFSWEQSSLKVQLPHSIPLTLVEENVRRSLSILGKPISIQSSRISDSLQIEVKVMDRTTHHLTFFYTRPPVLKTGLRPKIAIVIDDIGDENRVSRELLLWDVPLTFSVLPFTPYSKKFSREAQLMGKEVILHLPMEPHGYPKVKPGEGALLQEMDEEKLLDQLSKDIEAVPHIKGVNNHMGSRFMENPEKMRIVLAELKRRELFFLDSRTTHQSVGLRTAQSLGLRAMERSLFIDHAADEKEIEKKLERLARLSLSTGKAVGIGHPHPSTVKILKEMIPKMQERGIDIVPLSEMME